MENNINTVESVVDNESISKSNSFFTVSTKKLLIMSLVTLGFYNIYWFYKNWVVIQEETNKKEMYNGLKI